ncbi:hypothetical protein [Klebsiella quasipneumoniae]|uniref:hypothetical protein n=1 Tax=Klebsiella quasipneumoniae TaxID=1463165 RepID=UPI003F6DBCD1
MRSNKAFLELTRLYGLLQGLSADDDAQKQVLHAIVQLEGKSEGLLDEQRVDKTGRILQATEKHNRET